jgi:hypothetical protein
MWGDIAGVRLRLADLKTRRSDRPPASIGLPDMEQRVEPCSRGRTLFEKISVNGSYQKMRSPTRLIALRKSGIDACGV